MEINTWQLTSPQSPFLIKGLKVPKKVQLQLQTNGRKFIYLCQLVLYNGLNCTLYSYVFTQPLYVESSTCLRYSRKLARCFALNFETDASKNANNDCWQDEQNLDRNLKQMTVTEALFISY